MGNPAALRPRGSCPPPPEGAKRTAGCTRARAPRVTAAEAEEPGQPLLTLTQPGTLNSLPTAGRPWHGMPHQPGQALASCSLRGGRVPRALGPSRVRGTPAHLCLENGVGLAWHRGCRAADSARTSGHTGTRLGGHTTESTAGLPWPQGQSGTWTVPCDKQALRSSQGRGGAGSREGAGVRGRCWPHEARIPVDRKQTTAEAILSRQGRFPNRLLGRARNEARSAQHGSRVSPLCRPCSQAAVREGQGRVGMVRCSQGAGEHAQCACASNTRRGQPRGQAVCIAKT